MMKKPTDISAAAAAVRLMVNEPLPGTTLSIIAVASLVRITGSIIDDVVQSELLTNLDDSPAAILIVPDGLLIVCTPVVPVAVLVEKKLTLVLSCNFNISSPLLFLTRRAFVPDPIPDDVTLRPPEVAPVL